MDFTSTPQCRPLGQYSPAYSNTFIYQSPFFSPACLIFFSSPLFFFSFLAVSLSFVSPAPSSISVSPWICLWYRLHYLCLCLLPSPALCFSLSPPPLSPSSSFSHSSLSHFSLSLLSYSLPFLLSLSLLLSPLLLSLPILSLSLSLFFPSFFLLHYLSLSPSSFLQERKVISLRSSPPPFLFLFLNVWFISTSSLFLCVSFTHRHTQRDTHSHNLQPPNHPAKSVCRTDSPERRITVHEQPWKPASSMSSGAWPQCAR